MKLPCDPHEIHLIQVKKVTCEDDGSLLIFRDPQGQFHEVYGLPPSLENLARDGWRLVAAVKGAIEGRERFVYSSYSSRNWRKFILGITKNQISHCTTVRWRLAFSFPHIIVKYAISR
jgi:hypothetical protein